MLSESLLVDDCGSDDDDGGDDCSVAEESAKAKRQECVSGRRRYEAVLPELRMFWNVCNYVMFFADQRSLRPIWRLEKF